MNITLNKIVTIEYELTDEGGNVLDSSRGNGPLSYLHGSGTVLPALEEALDGHAPGEELAVSLAPDQAYGRREDRLRQTVPRDRFPADVPIEVGMQFQGRLAQDEGERVFTVVDVNEGGVTIDGNHPLADVTLNFDVQVVDVRDATREELEHGHPHGPGGAHGHGHDQEKG